MPGTAAMRGLDDSFDIDKALPASAKYLGELKTGFGNLGLAAAAYNAGEIACDALAVLGRLPAARDRELRARHHGRAGGCVQRRQTMPARCSRRIRRGSSARPAASCA